MESTLRARVQEILEHGGGEQVGDARVLPLVTLESGARQGLDGAARWALIPAESGAPVVIDEGNVHLLHEAIEQRRDDFDEAIEQQARALDLPVDELLFSYPVTALVRSILVKRSSYLTRLALAFLRTTELRALREEILVVTRDSAMPGPVKDLAMRLVVPL
ncbi:MAG: hypothetical protein ABI193_21850 [Minicystis sp.]